MTDILKPHFFVEQGVVSRCKICGKTAREIIDPVINCRAEKAEAEPEQARQEVERIKSGVQFGPCQPCQAKGCKNQADTGEPGPGGYKWLCHDHAVAYRAMKEGKNA